MQQSNLETTYGDCLSLILRDMLVSLHEKSQENTTAKSITVAIIQRHELTMSDYDKNKLQKRVKNKLKKLAKGGLVIINHRITKRKTIENTYIPNFK
jgi:chromosome condensin MukBEF MukE localization factor